MEMKIWALEKFERMMITMFSNSSTDEEQEPVSNRKLATTGYAPSRTKDDLTQLLRNEKSVTDRQQLWGDIVPFRGPHIFVHDMNEKTKPVMYREYNPVVHKEEGDWPMFHSVSLGRCPFVAEDPEKRDSRHARQEAMAEKKVQAEQKAPMTRAASVAREAHKLNKKIEDEKKAVLHENENAANRLAKPETVSAKPFEKPSLKLGLSGLDSMPPLILGSAHANFRGLARHPGGEPMASGVQPSNITSAIRSQMISSTAAAPVQRAATSKDMYNLQKRVLDRHSGRSVTSNPSSYMNDVRAAINDPQPRRTTRRRAAEMMTRIHEDEPLSGEDRKPIKQDMRAPKRRKIVERENKKPGYCENCREKYEDFNDVSLRPLLKRVTLMHCLARGNSKPQKIRIDERQLERTGRPSQAACSAIIAAVIIINVVDTRSIDNSHGQCFCSFCLYHFLRCFIQCWSPRLYSLP